jgi:hypothetical protein
VLNNLTIPLELSLPPTRVFARRIKHPLDATVQGSHDADPRQHRRAAALGDQDQRLHRRLPFRRFVLVQLSDHATFERMLDNR